MNILEKVIVFFGLTSIIYIILDVIISRIKHNKTTQTGLDGETKEKFQKLAGIKPHETGFLKNSSPRLVEQTNNKIIEAMLKAAETSDFPAPDETIPVKSTPITKIPVSTMATDSFAEIPLSRVSKEAKEQMAEIARKDIEKTLEAEAQRNIKLFPNLVEESIKVEDETGVKPTKTKRKYTKRKYKAN